MADIEWTNQRHQEILRQFQEYLEMNQFEQANEYLYMKTYFTQKKWTIVYETITKNLISLIIVHRKPEEKKEQIKEILKHYRNLTQQENTDSLNDILEHYLENSETLFNEKIQQYRTSEINEINDVEVDEIVTDFLVACNNLESKNRKEDIKSLIKFIWDTYKNIIDISRSNQRLQIIFVKVTEKALDFGHKYQRKGELKKFIDFMKRMFRETKQSIAREPDIYNKFKNFTELHNRETRTQYLDLRKKAYDICKSMNLWQECFKMVEDILILLQIKKGKKGMDIQKRYNSMYYEYLSEIFLHSSCQLYHAFFYLQHYEFYVRYNKDKLKDQSDKLALAVLSIPPQPQEMEFNKEKQQTIKDFILVENKHINNRKELIDILQTLNIIDNCSEPIQELFHLVLQNLSFFTFSSKVQKILDFIRQSENCSAYIQMIEQNLVFLVIQQVSDIYKTIKISNLRSLISFIPQYDTDQKILKLLTEQCTMINCKIDMDKGIVIFHQKNQFDIVDAQNRLIEFSSSVTLIAHELAPPCVKLPDMYINDIQEYMQKSKKLMKDRLEEIKRQKIKKNQDYLTSQQKIDEEEKRLREYEIKRNQDEINRQLEIQKAMKRKIEQETQQKQIVINEIIELKGKSIVRVNGKKLEHLDNEDIQLIDIQDLENTKKTVKEKQKENLEKKAQVLSLKLDFIERERRDIELQILQKINDNDYVEQMQKDLEQSQENNRRRIEQQQELISTLQFKEKFFQWQEEIRKQDFEVRNSNFKEKCMKYKDKILEQAKLLQTEFKEAEVARIKRKEETEALNIKTAIQETDVIISRNMGLIKSAPAEEVAEVKFTGFGRNTNATTATAKEPERRIINQNVVLERKKPGEVVEKKEEKKEDRDGFKEVAFSRRTNDAPPVEKKVEKKEDKDGFKEVAFSRRTNDAPPANKFDPPTNKFESKFIKQDTKPTFQRAVQETNSWNNTSSIITKAEITTKDTVAGNKPADKNAVADGFTKVQEKKKTSKQPTGADGWKNSKK